MPLSMNSTSKPVASNLANHLIYIANCSIHTGLIKHKVSALVSLRELAMQDFQLGFPNELDVLADI